MKLVAHSWKPTLTTGPLGFSKRPGAAGLHCATVEGMGQDVMMNG